MMHSDTAVFLQSLFCRYTKVYPCIGFEMEIKSSISVNHFLLFDWWQPVAFNLEHLGRRLLHQAHRHRHHNFHHFWQRHIHVNDATIPYKECHSAFEMLKVTNNQLTTALKKPSYLRIVYISDRLLKKM